MIIMITLSEGQFFRFRGPQAGLVSPKPTPLFKNRRSLFLKMPAPDGRRPAIYRNAARKLADGKMGAESEVKVQE